MGCARTFDRNQDVREYPRCQTLPKPQQCSRYRQLKQPPVFVVHVLLEQPIRRYRSPIHPPILGYVFYVPLQD